MLKRISAAIRAVLAGMARYIVEVVRIGDRLISRLVLAPADVGQADVPETSPAVQQLESMTALRNAANSLVQGYSLTPAQYQSMPALQGAWLRSMTRPELCKLILAKDDAIRAHIRGIEPIRGIVPYHSDAIRDVTAARKDALAPKPDRRTLRAVLAEQGHPIAMA